MTQDLVARLRAIGGDRSVLTGADIGARHFTDARGEGADAPVMVLRPATTQELAQMLATCHAARQPVCVQGGMTGLVHGARPLAGEAALSLERMTAMEPVNRPARTITVQAGVPLQKVQEAAAEAGLFYPLDLGARGSCTIGGNLATNAGGNRVIRYGMTRDLALGLEVVLADGTVISNLSGFIKNNTGYDLKQLFIGSEGTLGVITRATLRLFPQPRSQTVAYCALPDFAAVRRFLAHMQQGLGGDLSAFEVLWPQSCAAIASGVPGLRMPIAPGPEFHVLTEGLGGDATRDSERFEAVLAEAFEAGLLRDAVLSKSEAEARAFWDVRDGMATALSALPNAVGFDISLEIGDMEGLYVALMRRFAVQTDSATVLIGGHLGDGNLHLSIAAARAGQPLTREQIEAAVYAEVGELSGSVSAEHGIGLCKRAHLPQSRSVAELAIMRRLKDALDPHGLLGRGRIFESR